MTFLIIVAVVAPVFLTIAAGSAVAVAGRMRVEFNDGLMWFGQNIAIPCLLFAGILRYDAGAGFAAGLIAAFYGASAVCFVLGALGGYFLFRRPPREAVTAGFSALYANVVLLGVPITQQVFGDGMLAGNYLLAVVQAPICYLLGIAVMELIGANGRGGRGVVLATFATLARHPHMIAVMLGLAVRLAGVMPFRAVMSAVDMVGSAALPASLFALGGMLTRFRFHGSVAVTGYVVFLSLVVRPTLALLLGHYVLALPHQALVPVVVTAAMAPGLNTFMFADMYGQARDITSGAIVAGTVLSVASASAWITVLLAWF